jgi:hypothetical protein
MRGNQAHRGVYEVIAADGLEGVGPAQARSAG